MTDNGKEKDKDPLRVLPSEKADEPQSPAAAESGSPPVTHSVLLLCLRVDRPRARMLPIATAAIARSVPG